MQSNLYGLIRRLNPFQNSAENTFGVAVVNSRGEIVVAQGMPPDAELLRLGASFYIIQSTAVAPVAAMPTTVAQLSLFNGESAGGKSYLIDSLFAFFATSMAVAGQIGIAVMISPPTVAAPTAAGLLVRSMSGKAGTANSKSVNSVGNTVVDNGWMPWGSSEVVPNTTNAALAIDLPVKGALIVPPQAMISIAVLAQTAVGTCRAGIRWHEVGIDVA